MGPFYFLHVSWQKCSFQLFVQLVFPLSRIYVSWERRERVCPVQSYPRHSVHPRGQSLRGLRGLRSHLRDVPNKWMDVASLDSHPRKALMDCSKNDVAQWRILAHLGLLEAGMGVPGCKYTPHHIHKVNICIHTHSLFFLTWLAPRSNWSNPTPGAVSITT